MLETFKDPLQFDSNGFTLRYPDSNSYFRNRRAEKTRVAFGESIVELQELVEEVLEENKIANDKIVLVTDSNINVIYGDQLRQVGFDVHSFPAGEDNKNDKTAQHIRDYLLEKKARAVIGLGGGVSTDIVGKAASVVNRGLPWIASPTSLVGAVDAAFGGKVAINTKYGKNTDGAFHFPIADIIIPSFLDTIPLETYQKELGEVVKYAMISSDYSDFLEDNLDLVKNNDPKIRRQLIENSLIIKGYYVYHDQYDLGLRQIINFGHTIGHAIEQASGYDISHGQAVAIGMVYEAKIAVQEGLWSQDDYNQLIYFLDYLDLPTKIPDNISIDNILESAFYDKKIDSSTPNDSIPIRIPTSSPNNPVFYDAPRKQVVEMFQ